MALRVLVVNDFQVAGGAETVAWTLAAGLEERGVEVERFFASAAHEFPDNPWRYLNNRPLTRRLARTMSCFRPDIVHFHNYYHLLSPAALAIPEVGQSRVVVTAHDHHLWCPNPSGREFPRGGAARMADAASLVDVVRGRWDDSSIRSVARKTQHIYAYRLRRLQRAIDEIHCPASFQMRLLSHVAPTVHVPNPVTFPSSGIARRTRRGLLFAGRVAPEKGLAKAMAEMPISLLAELSVAGTGPDLELCQRIAQERGVQVRFLGYLSAEEIWTELSHARVLFFPSVWPEVSPLAVIEAFGACVDVFAPATGGIPELAAEADAGLLYDPTVPGSFERTLERLGEVPQSTDWENVRAIHSVDQYLNSTVERYERLVARRKL